MEGLPRSMENVRKWWRVWWYGKLRFYKKHCFPYHHTLHHFLTFFMLRGKPSITFWRFLNSGANPPLLFVVSATRLPPPRGWGKGGEPESRGGGRRVAETAKSIGGFAPESGKRQKVMEGLPRSMENVRKWWRVWWYAKVCFF